MTIKKREIYSRFSGTTEVDYICSRHLCVAVNMKCHLCAAKPVPVLDPEMKALVDAFNTLTGKRVKRFASLDVGAMRLARAQRALEGPTAGIPANRRNRYPVVMAGAKTGIFKSLRKALITINVPRRSIGKWRTTLRETGTVTIVNGDKTYTFTLGGAQ